MSRRRGRVGLEWAILLPTLLPVALFSVLPIGYGIFLAFTNARAGNNLQFEFTGLENFKRLVSDAPFLGSLQVGLIWALGVTGVTLISP